MLRIEGQCLRKANLFELVSDWVLKRCAALGSIKIIRGLVQGAAITAFCAVISCVSSLVVNPAMAEDADIRLVIDISGSMKRNDPQNLRQPAVALLMDLLPNGSRAGVWTFGKEVNMLVPFGEVNPQWRSMAAEKASQISSVGLYTNIGGALETAAAIDPPSNSKAHIILLTDGMVDIDKDPSVNQQEWRRIADEILPTLKKQGFVVHTVSLSETADANLMQKLSLATDGHSATAKTAEDLMPAFLKAFDSAAPTQQLPLTGNQFVVDSSVEEFTALMFRDDVGESIALIGPDENAITHSSVNPDARWHHTSNYDLVTITRPLEGEWQVRGKLADGSRVTVVSDLNLRVKSLPINASLGSVLDLQFVLVEDDKTITRGDFLSLLSITAQSTRQNSEVPSWRYQFEANSPPVNGVFSASVEGFTQPGNYILSVALDGKSFQRSFAHQLLVRMPFTAEVTEAYNENSQRQFTLSVKKNVEAISARDTQLALTVTSPDRRKQVQPLRFTASETWEFTLLPEQEGLYRLEVKIIGVDNKGEAFEYRLNDLHFDYQPTSDFETLTTAPASEVSQSSEASVAAISSAASTSSEESQEPLSEPSEEIPPWLFYSSLGLANIILLGVGITIFRKIVGPTTDLKLEQVTEDIASRHDVAARVEPEPVDPSVMKMDEMDDEIPPMEDLEPDMDFEEDDDPEEDTRKRELPVERIDENFDFDLSSLDSDEGDGRPPLQPSVSLAAESSVAAENDGLAGSREEIMDDGQASDQDDEALQAKIKMQGLDLAENELDDAISHLIEELDDEDTEEANPEESNAGQGAGEMNLDDFDFDEDDNK
jgi:uncharacterized protein (TIGR03503 family)